MIKRQNSIEKIFSSRASSKHGDFRLYIPAESFSPKGQKLSVNVRER